MKRLALYATSLPADIIGWLILIAFRVLWGRGLTWRAGVLAVELRPESWFARRFYQGWGGTTICPHGILFGPGEIVSEQIWKHELIHVEEFEAICFHAAAVLGVAALGRWAFVAFVLCAPWTMYVASVMTAKLRGEADGYRGSFLEESAYSQAGGEKGQEK